VQNSTHRGCNGIDIIAVHGHRMHAVIAECLARIPIGGASSRSALAPEAINFTLPVARAHRDKHSASLLSGGGWNKKL